MNQIFRITVGQETLSGRLPTLRVGLGYCSLFHISGVSPSGAAPKVWVSVDEESPDYWEGIWDSERGVWVVEVGNSVTATAGTYAYAITMGGAEADDPEYIAGQGAFVVYTSITCGGGTQGEPGTSWLGLLQELSERVENIEAVLEAGAVIGMFDPETAFDIDLRTQVQSITNILRGYVPAEAGE
jgi:hypothetical protein